MTIILWLIELLMALLFVGSRQDVSATPPPVFPTATPSAEAGESGVYQSMAVVESVDALLLESYPVQIQLRVSGYHPDGCEFPVIVEQQRDGNTVTVQIYRSFPSDFACPEVIVPFEQTIGLEGGFETGSYTIIVNDQTINVTI